MQRLELGLGLEQLLELAQEPLQVLEQVLEQRLELLLEPELEQPLAQPLSRWRHRNQVLQWLGSKRNRASTGLSNFSRHRRTYCASCR